MLFHCRTGHRVTFMQSTSGVTSMTKIKKLLHARSLGHFSTVYKHKEFIMMKGEKSAAMNYILTKLCAYRSVL